MLVVRRDESVYGISKMKFNTEYVRTKAGVLSGSLLFLLLICFISMVATGRPSGTHAAYLIATIVGFFATLFFMVVKLFSIDQSLRLPWTFVEFVYVIIWAIFFLVVSALALDFGGNYIAAGIFGLFATVLYIGKIIFIYITEVMPQNTQTPYPTVTT